MTLYITEKASQVKALNDVLKKIYNTKDYKIENLSGHILQLYNPTQYPDGLTKNWVSDFHENKLPYVPKTWKKQLEQSKKRLFDNVKTRLKDCDEIILAPDPDNEGVVLVMEVLEVLNATNKIKGMINMNKLDAKSLSQEVQIINKIPYLKMYESGLARSYSDWIFGMNGTVAASVIFGKHFQTILNNSSPTLHIGGVKLPTIAMVVDRDYQFENFKNIPFWQIKGKGEKNGEFFDFIVEVNNESKFDKEENAQNLLKKLENTKSKVSNFEEKEKFSAPPKPYSLINLQSARNNKYKIGIDESLKIAQRLYEKKYQSYPRTDNNYYAEGEYDNVINIMDMVKTISSEYKNIIDKMKKPFLKRNIFDDKKITAHTALSPTDNFPKELSDKEKKIYELVLKRYLIQFLDDYKYLSIKGESKTVIEEVFLKFNENITIEKGWKEIDDTKDNDDENNNDKNTRTIPKFNINDEFNIIELKIHKGETKPKPRFNETSLAVAMENIASFYDDPEIKKNLKKEGIGMPSTRSVIITDLIKTGYFEIEKKGKKLKSTLKARELIKILPEEMYSPILRAKLEGNLKLILNNQKTCKDVEIEFKEFTRNMIEKMKNKRKTMGITIQKGNKKSNLICPKCNKGNVIETDKIFKCSEMKWNPKTKKNTGCPFVIFKNNNTLKKDLSIEDIKELINNNTLKNNEGEIKLNLNEKYFIEVLKGNKGGGNNEKTHGNITENDKLFKITGTDNIIWKNFMGIIITLDIAKKAFNKEIVSLKGLKNKNGTIFNANVFFDFDNKKLSIKNFFK